MEIIWLCAYYIFAAGGYMLLSHQPTERHFMTPWDKYVPTVPVFIIPYLFATFTYLAFPIFLYLRLGWDRTKPYLLVSVVANLIGYLTYVFWPTSVTRDPISGNGLWYDSLRLLHATDRPSAAFPSGHVYNSIIIGYFCWIYFPVTRPYVAVIIPLILLATVFLKQHYLPDILGGILVAVVSILVIKVLKYIK